MKNLTFLPNPHDAFIGADPAIGQAGLALVLRDLVTQQFYIHTTNTIKTKSSDSNTKRLDFVYCETCRIVENYLSIINTLKGGVDIKNVVGGLEVPAIISSGFGNRETAKFRISRDLTQREAVAMMRLALYHTKIDVIGQEDEKPIRPNQVHAILSKEHHITGDKKEDIRNLLKKECKLINTELKTLDESDASAIAIVSAKIFHGDKSKKLICVKTKKTTT